MCLQAIKNHWNSTLAKKREQILAESGRRAGMKRSAEDDEHDGDDSKRAKTDGCTEPHGICTPMGPAIIAQGCCTTPACAFAHTKQLLVLRALLGDCAELKDFEAALVAMEEASSVRESREVSVSLSYVDEEDEDEKEHAGEDHEHKKLRRTLQCDDIDIACSSPDHDDVGMEDFGVCVMAVSPSKLDGACFVHGEEVSIAELGRMDASFEDYDIKDSKDDAHSEDSYSSASTSPEWEKPETPDHEHEHDLVDDCKPSLIDMCVPRDGCISPTSFLASNSNSNNISATSHKACSSIIITGRDTTTTTTASPRMLSTGAMMFSPAASFPTFLSVS
jgi:hypothetical protein